MLLGCFLLPACGHWCMFGGVATLCSWNYIIYHKENDFKKNCVDIYTWDLCMELSWTMLHLRVFLPYQAPLKGPDRWPGLGLELSPWGQRAVRSNKAGSVWEQGEWANAPARARVLRNLVLLLLWVPGARAQGFRAFLFQSLGGHSFACVCMTYIHITLTCPYLLRTCGSCWWAKGRWCSLLECPSFATNI